MDDSTWIADDPATLVISCAVVGALTACVILLRWIRYIPNTRVGIVEKLISARGSVRRGLIALHGEAGFQPEVLRGGWHLLTPLQYRIHRVPLVTLYPGDEFGPDIAASARSVLDDDGLAEPLGQLGRDDARLHVVDGAGR